VKTKASVTILTMLANRGWKVLTTTTVILLVLR